MSIVVIDFFQYAAIGPSIRGTSPLVYWLAAAMSVNLQEFTTLRGGVYWFILNIVFALCAVWFVSCIIVVKKIDLRWDR
jgi:hypothetical protein